MDFLKDSVFIPFPVCLLIKSIYIGKELEVKCHNIRWMGMWIIIFSLNFLCIFYINMDRYFKSIIG